MYEVLIERIKKCLNSLELTVEEKKQIKYVMLGSITLAALLLIMDNRPPSTTLWRNTYGGGSVEQELLVTMGEMWDKEPITITLGPQDYTQEEFEEASQGAWLEVLELIKADHGTLETVSGSLILPTRVSGYPFDISWSWSPSSALSRDGSINEDTLEDHGLVVELRATMNYLDKELIQVQSVRLVAAEKSHKIMAMEELLHAIENGHEGSITQPSYTLPEEVLGEEIQWGKVYDYRGFLVGFLGLVIALLLLWKKKQDMEIEQLKEQDQMEQDYPEIISTFVLYMEAGMTSKRAWGKMVDNYKESGKSRVAYDQMHKTYIEMLNGGSESGAYEHFAYRVDIPCYRKFGLLLAQNLKKGTKGISQILEKEAYEAFEDRKRRAKSLGEAAGTKLLMPMFLMLAVVLVIVVVPAFFSMEI